MQLRLCLQLSPQSIRDIPLSLGIILDLKKIHYGVTLESK